jgi:ADP-ribose pyrophosphatase
LLDDDSLTRRNDRSLKAWQVLRRRELLDGSPWLRVWAEDVRLPNGTVIEGFYKLEMPDYVVVVPMCDDGVVVQRMYKHGPGGIGLHVPAGYIETGEEPLAAAQRELLEETGCSADDWTYLGRLTNDGNRGSGAGHFFLARDVHKTGKPIKDELEVATVETISLDQLVEAVLGGEVPLLSIAGAVGLAVMKLGEEAHEP